MKKLHLHKIFHWLYAVLMFLPFIFLGAEILSHFGVPFTDESLYTLWYDILDTLCNSFDFNPLYNVFAWLDNFFGSTWSLSLIFIYWVVVSIYWLVFDVLMYLINVAHHWLDAGGDKL